MSKQTIGGNRLGSGAGQTFETKHFNRSSHDMGYIWKSSAAAGTLIPFMVEPILPGSSMDIDLETVVMTHPTIGPLFGSYKIQLDVFLCPIRLYNAHLHMNALNIGMEMSQIKLPQMRLSAMGKNEDAEGEVDDNGQINPSSLLSYLNIRGIGQVTRDTIGNPVIEREFNALSYLMYWDIYKNYYADKQQGIGVYINNKPGITMVMIGAIAYIGTDEVNIMDSQEAIFFGTETRIEVAFSGWEEGNNPPNKNEIKILSNGGSGFLVDLFQEHIWSDKGGWIFSNVKEEYYGMRNTQVPKQNISNSGNTGDKPELKTFPLENIDEMRLKLLTNQSKTAPFIINIDFLKEPYSTINERIDERWSKQKNQEGLAIKTYQSDLFNNWVNTEWIDGETGVNALTAVDTTSGEFTMDALNMAKKVYEMLNGIATSGGTYNNWVEVVYDHEGFRSYETPIYLGGLIRELSFDEVVSNSATSDEPLGTLAGRGSMTSKKKGGKITVRVDEPSYVMGIFSLTPRVDYSQGNKWDNNLKNMDEFHKPHLDEIGFQDLITDQMAWGDTFIDQDGKVTFKSAGKIPAWSNYMTNVNQVRGNFADKKQQMYMTLNRRYEVEGNGITDLTTYIDPSKFNHIFADTRIDAQNFWVQIKVDNIARRKMSSKVMPNM